MPTHPPVFPRSIGFVLTGLLTVGGLGTVAAETPSTPPASAAVPESTPPPAAAAPAPPMTGLRAFIDPETGELIEPPLAAKGQLTLSPETQAALSQSSAGLSQVVLPDGTAFVRLEGRFQSMVFATVDAAGQVTISHRPPVPEAAMTATHAPAESEAEHVP